MTDEQKGQLELLKTAHIAASIAVVKSHDFNAAWRPVCRLLDIADRTVEIAYQQWAATTQLKYPSRPCLPWPAE